MMSTIEDAGTNFEESAATMTVPGKEMKDGEGTIGMTGETILTSFPLDPTPPALTTLPRRRFCFFCLSLSPCLPCFFPYRVLLGCNLPLSHFCSYVYTLLAQSL